MQDLTPAGLTEDGTCLLLVTARGERFRLPVDDQLQRLVGSPRRLVPEPAPPTQDPAQDPNQERAQGPDGSRTPAAPAPTFESRRPHQQEHTMDSALRPRDIQARIRSGESAETVAAAAGTSVEAIMPFAAPVLAERAHQAQTALRASVRRGAGQSTGARTLGDAVAQYLSTEHLQDDDVAWDSWRRPDGRWALTARVEAGGRTLEAELLHDVAGRYVVAENDDARLLTGEARPAAPAAPEPGQRRLSSVGPQSVGPDPAHDTDLDRLGEDAIALVRDRRDEPTVLGGDPLPVPHAPEPDPEPEPEPEAEPAPEPAPHPEPAPGPGPAASVEDTEETQELDTTDEPAASGTDTEDGEQPELDLGVPEEDKPRRGRRGRSSVPSWDEIMFGGGPGKD